MTSRNWRGVTAWNPHVHLHLIVLQRIVDAVPEGIRLARGSRRGGKPAPPEVLAIEGVCGRVPGDPAGDAAE
jgi:hypothetical protein